MSIANTTFSLDFQSRLLLVEGGATPSNGVEEALKLENYLVERVEDGAAANELVIAERFDLLILDSVLAGTTGLEVCGRVRKEGIYTPILLLTEPGRASDTARALRIGANDCLSKPFDPVELLARVQALLRRFGRDPMPRPARSIFDDITVDFIKQRVYRAGNPVDLSEGVYDHLIQPCIIEHPRTISRGLERRRLQIVKQGAKRRLEEPHAELERQLEEQTRELRSANEELLRNSAANDVFLATLSHELRTPLTPIVGWVQVLLNNPTPEMMLNGLRTIERNALLQSKLIEEFLDLSRVITGKLTLTPESLDLRSVAESAVDTVREKAVEKDIRLAVKVPEDPVMVHGVQARLEQILWNLLTNAIKFTKGGGSVALTVEVSGDETKVSVSDTGIGISSEFLPHVFERFKQAEWFKKRKRDGLGLGLAMVEGLVKLHHGRVAVQSPGIGYGSTFTVTLPLAAPVIRQTEMVQDMESGALDLRGPVVVIDDSVDTLEVMTVILRHAGLEVLAASNVPEALDLIHDHPPGAIITDIGLPGIDGFSILSEFRHLLPAKIPVIAISGFAEEKFRQRALALGFADYLTKPADPDAILASIRRAVDACSNDPPNPYKQ